MSFNYSKLATLKPSFIKELEEEQNRQKDQEEKQNDQVDLKQNDQTNLIDLTSDLDQRSSNDQVPDQSSTKLIMSLAQNGLSPKRA